MKLWAGQAALRHVGVWYRGVREFLGGRSSEHRMDWIQKVLEQDLLPGDLAASLAWTDRYGTVLRVLF